MWAQSYPFLTHIPNISSKVVYAIYWISTNPEYSQQNKNGQNVAKVLGCRNVLGSNVLRLIGNIIRTRLCQDVGKHRHTEDSVLGFRKKNICGSFIHAITTFWETPARHTTIWVLCIQHIFLIVESQFSLALAYDQHKSW